MTRAFFLLSAYYDLGGFIMNNCNDDDLICGSDLCNQECENGGFTPFGTGPFFPPIPPIPPIPPCLPRTFSFYSVRGATVISGGTLPLTLFSGTPLPVTADGVTLPFGNVYITYTFQCTTENNVVSVEVVPYINGTAITPGAFRAVRTPSGLHSEAVGTFIYVSDGSASVSFRVLTDESVSVNGISFDLLIVPVF